MEIKVYQDLMGENEKWAAKTRALLHDKHLSMFNFIGSPGGGKTTLLEDMVARLAGNISFAVLEGDVETTKDAERLAKLDIPVSQLLTKGACHLEAKLVHYSLKDFDLEKLDLVIVENVGNLVCPAEFDVGEDAKIAVLSVTEGEEKPLKYPLLFREAGAVVITKTDLLPHLNYDIEACIENIKEVNADIPIFKTASVTGDGMQEFVDWLTSQGWHE